MENVLFYPLMLLADLYYFYMGQHNYWKNRGVPHVKSKFHYGNLKPFWDGTRSLPDLTRDIYNAFPHSRFVGYFHFNLPMLMLRDYDLIEQITKRDAECFREHRMFASPSADPLWAKNIFAMEGGSNWKELRTAAAASFSDNRLRIMFEIINNRTIGFVDYFTQPDVKLIMEMSDAFNRVTNDIIAGTIFGHSCDSLRDRKNDFYVKVHEAADVNGNRYNFFMASIHPSLPNWYDVRFISESTTMYFKRVVENAIECLEIGRNDPQDVISDLMTYREKNKEITNEVITAVAVEFFLAGFDTTSRALTFTAYELACNQEIQDKLRREIDNISFHIRPITFDVIRNMKHIDMVVSEALRKWPPFAVTDRKLFSSYTIQPGPEEENPVHLEGDMVCILPIFAMHRDPLIYPNPEKFDPERFRNRTENMRHYLPFGEGMRKCIGNRFAVLEIKTVLFHLLRKFKIVPVENITQIPLVLNKQQINLVPEEGVWLQLIPREDF